MTELLTVAKSTINTSEELIEEKKEKHPSISIASFTKTWAMHTGKLHHEMVAKMRAQVFNHMDSTESKKAYHRYLSHLYPLFKRVEGQLEKQKGQFEILRKFTVALEGSDHLKREGALQKDLSFIAKELKLEPPCLSEKMQKTLDKVELLKPHELLAYSFNLQLAALVGGKRTRERFLASESPFWKNLTHFYEFGPLTEEPFRGAFYEEYKSALNNLLLSKEEKDEFLKASKEVFKAIISSL